MKLGEAIPKYQAYRNQLQDKRRISISSLRMPGIKQNAQEMTNGRRRRRSSSFHMTRHQRILTNMRMHLMDLESSGVRLLMQRMPRHSQIRRRDLGQQ